ncbi:MAG: HpcH/HpaI aldolase/citrate lyase family protein [Candidatus Bathyarchaeia archaeon]
MRTLLFTPGNNWRMIQKARQLAADAVILDLEDAVPMAEKETARIFVRDGIPLIKAGGLQAFVRVNSLTTGLTQQDLESSVQGDLDGIVLPKAESKEDITEVEGSIEGLERERDLPLGSVAIVPLLETARGVVNVDEIILASERVISVCFGAMDFTRDMGTSLSRDGWEIFFARSKIALVANAYNVQAIDTPWFDLADEEGLVNDAGLARRLGYRGKLLIHPDQIEAVNEIFSPSAEEIGYAEKVVEAFREAEARGLGATALDGKMIDLATFRQAEDLLRYAEAIAEKERGRTT